MLPSIYSPFTKSGAQVRSSRGGASEGGVPRSPRTPYPSPCKSAGERTISERTNATVTTEVSYRSSSSGGGGAIVSASANASLGQRRGSSSLQQRQQQQAQASRTSTNTAGDDTGNTGAGSRSTTSSLRSADHTSSGMPPLESIALSAGVPARRPSLDRCPPPASLRAEDIVAEPTTPSLCRSSGESIAMNRTTLPATPQTQATAAAAVDTVLHSPRASVRNSPVGEGFHAGSRSLLRSRGNRPHSDVALRFSRLDGTLLRMSDVTPMTSTTLACSAAAAAPADVKHSGTSIRRMGTDVPTAGVFGRPRAMSDSRGIERDHSYPLGSARPTPTRARAVAAAAAPSLTNSGSETASSNAQAMIHASPVNATLVNPTADGAAPTSSTAVEASHRTSVPVFLRHSEKRSGSDHRNRSTTGIGQGRHHVAATTSVTATALPHTPEKVKDAASRHGLADNSLANEKINATNSPSNKATGASVLTTTAAVARVPSYLASTPSPPQRTQGGRSDGIVRQPEHERVATATTAVDTASAASLVPQAHQRREHFASNASDGTPACGPEGLDTSGAQMLSMDLNLSFIATPATQGSKTTSCSPTRLRMTQPATGWLSTAGLFASCPTTRPGESAWNRSGSSAARRSSQLRPQQQQQVASDISRSSQGGGDARAKADGSEVRTTWSRNPTEESVVSPNSPDSSTPSSSSSPAPAPAAPSSGASPKTVSVPQAPSYSAATAAATSVSAEGMSAAKCGGRDAVSPPATPTRPCDAPRPPLWAGDFDDAAANRLRSHTPDGTPSGRPSLFLADGRPRAASACVSSTNPMGIAINPAGSGASSGSWTGASPRASAGTPTTLSARRRSSTGRVSFVPYEAADNTAHNRTAVATSELSSPSTLNAISMGGGGGGGNTNATAVSAGPSIVSPSLLSSRLDPSRRRRGASGLEPAGLIASPVGSPPHPLPARSPSPAGATAITASGSDGKKLFVNVRPNAPNQIPPRGVSPDDGAAAAFRPNGLFDVVAESGSSLRSLAGSIVAGGGAIGAGGVSVLAGNDEDRSSLASRVNVMDDATPAISRLGSGIAGGTSTGGHGGRNEGVPLNATLTSLESLSSPCSGFVGSKANAQQRATSLPPNAAHNNAGGLMTYAPFLAMRIGSGIASGVVDVNNGSTLNSGNAIVWRGVDGAQQRSGGPHTCTADFGAASAMPATSTTTAAAEHSGLGAQPANRSLSSFTQTPPRPSPGTIMNAPGTPATPATPNGASPSPQSKVSVPTSPFFDAAAARAEGLPASITPGGSGYGSHSGGVRGGTASSGISQSAYDTSRLPRGGDTSAPFANIAAYWADGSLSGYGPAPGYTPHRPSQHPRQHSLNSGLILGEATPNLMVPLSSSHAATIQQQLAQRSSSHHCATASSVSVSSMGAFIQRSDVHASLPVEGGSFASLMSGSALAVKGRSGGGEGGSSSQPQQQLHGSHMHPDHRRLRPQLHSKVKRRSREQYVLLTMTDGRQVLTAAPRPPSEASDDGFSLAFTGYPYSCPEEVLEAAAVVSAAGSRGAALGSSFSASSPSSKAAMAAGLRPSVRRVFFVLANRRVRRVDSHRWHRSSAFVRYTTRTAPRGKPPRHFARPYREHQGGEMSGLRQDRESGNATGNGDHESKDKTISCVRKNAISNSSETEDASRPTSSSIRRISYGHDVSMSDTMTEMDEEDDDAANMGPECEVVADGLAVDREVDGDSIGSSASFTRSYASSFYAREPETDEDNEDEVQAETDKKVGVKVTGKSAVSEPHTPRTFYRYHAESGEKLGKVYLRFLRWHHRRRRGICSSATAANTNVTATTTSSEPNVISPTAAPMKLPKGQRLPPRVRELSPEDRHLLLYPDVDVDALGDIDNRLRAAFGLKPNHGKANAVANEEDCSRTGIAADTAKPFVLVAGDAADDGSSQTQVDSLLTILAPTNEQLPARTGYELCDYYAPCPICNPDVVLPISSASVARREAQLVEAGLGYGVYENEYAVETGRWHPPTTDDAATNFQRLWHGLTGHGLARPHVMAEGMKTAGTEAAGGTIRTDHVKPVPAMTVPASTRRERPYSTTEADALEHAAAMTAEDGAFMAVALGNGDKGFFVDCQEDTHDYVVEGGRTDGVDGNGGAKRHPHRLRHSPHGRRMQDPSTHPSTAAATASRTTTTTTITTISSHNQDRYPDLSEAEDSDIAACGRESSRLAGLDEGGAFTKLWVPEALLDCMQDRAADECHNLPHRHYHHGGESGVDAYAEADHHTLASGRSESESGSGTSNSGGSDSDEDSELLTSDVYSCCSCSFCRARCGTSLVHQGPLAHQSSGNAIDSASPKDVGKGNVMDSSTNAIAAVMTATAKGGVTMLNLGKCVCNCEICTAHRQAPYNDAHKQDKRMQDLVEPVTPISPASPQAKPQRQQQQPTSLSGAPMSTMSSRPMSPVGKTALSSILCIATGNGETAYVGPRTSKGAWQLLADAILLREHRRREAEEAEVAAAATANVQRRRHHRNGRLLLDLPPSCEPLLDAHAPTVKAKKGCAAADSCISFDVDDGSRHRIPQRTDDGTRVMSTTLLPGEGPRARLPSSTSTSLQDTTTTTLTNTLNLTGTHVNSSACRGNDGKGDASVSQLKRSPDAPAVTEITAILPALSGADRSADGSGGAFSSSGTRGGDASPTSFAYTQPPYVKTEGSAVCPYGHYHSVSRATEDTLDADAAVAANVAGTHLSVSYSTAFARRPTLPPSAVEQQQQQQCMKARFIPVASSGEARGGYPAGARTTTDSYPVRRSLSFRAMSPMAGTALASHPHLFSTALIRFNSIQSATSNPNSNNDSLRASPVNGGRAVSPKTTSVGSMGTLDDISNLRAPNSQIYTHGGVPSGDKNGSNNSHPVRLDAGGSEGNTVGGVVMNSTAKRELVQLQLQLQQRAQAQHHPHASHHMLSPGNHHVTLRVSPTSTPGSARIRRDGVRPMAVDESSFPASFSGLIGGGGGGGSGGALNVGVMASTGASGTEAYAAIGFSYTSNGGSQKPSGETLLSTALSEYPVLLFPQCSASQPLEMASQVSPTGAPNSNVATVSVTSVEGRSPPSATRPRQLSFADLSRSGSEFGRGSPQRGGVAASPSKITAPELTVRKESPVKLRAGSGPSTAQDEGGAQATLPPPSPALSQQPHQQTPKKQQQQPSPQQPSPQSQQPRRTQPTYVPRQARALAAKAPGKQSTSTTSATTGEKIGEIVGSDSGGVSSGLSSGGGAFGLPMSE